VRLQPSELRRRRDGAKVHGRVELRWDFRGGTEVLFDGPTTLRLGKRMIWIDDFGSRWEIAEEDDGTFYLDGNDGRGTLELFDSKADIRKARRADKAAAAAEEAAMTASLTGAIGSLLSGTGATSISTGGTTIPLTPGAAATAGPDPADELIEHAARALERMIDAGEDFLDAVLATGLDAEEIAKRFKAQYDVPQAHVDAAADFAAATRI